MPQNFTNIKQRKTGRGALVIEEFQSRHLANITRVFLQVFPQNVLSSVHRWSISSFIIQDPLKSVRILSFPSNVLFMIQKHAIQRVHLQPCLLLSFEMQSVDSKG